MIVGAIWAVAAKDLRLLWRDRAAFLLAFAWPVAVAIFVGGLAPGFPRDGPVTPFEVTFPQGMLWGVISCAATFGIGLVNERRAGTLARLQVAPVPPSAVLAGKALAGLLAALSVELVLLTIGVIGFGLRPASLGLLALALVSVPVGLCGLTTLLASIVKTVRSAGGVTWVVLMTLAMMGGAMLPLASLPPEVQRGAMVSPVAWGILVIEAGTWRAWSLAEALPFLAGLWALGVASVLVGARAFTPR